MTLSTALLLGWAGVAAWMDLLQRRVRWWWSLLGLVGAGAYRLANWIRDGLSAEQALIIFVTLTVSYGLWKADWWGGADAKTSMTLVTAIPDLAFIAVIAVVAFVASSVRLLARKGQRSFAQVATDAVYVVKAGVREGERFPLVAVMVGALPVYFVLRLVVG